MGLADLFTTYASLLMKTQPRQTENVHYRWHHRFRNIAEHVTATNNEFVKKSFQRAYDFILGTDKLAKVYSGKSAPIKTPMQTALQQKHFPNYFFKVQFFHSQNLQNKRFVFTQNFKKNWNRKEKLYQVFLFSLAFSFLLLLFFNSNHLF